MNNSKAFVIYSSLEALPSYGLWTLGFWFHLCWNRILDWFGTGTHQILSPQSVETPAGKDRAHTMHFVLHVRWLWADGGVEVLLCHITVVDDSRAQKRDKTVEYLSVLSPPWVARDGAHVKRKVLHKTTIREPIQAQDRLCVCIKCAWDKEEMNNTLEYTYLDISEVADNQFVLVDTGAPVEDIFLMLWDESHPVFL